MPEELLVYRTFATQDDALQVLTVLEDNGITGEIAASFETIDAVFVGKRYDDHYILRIKGGDFEKATSVLEQYTNKGLENIDPTHPLLALNQDELMDIVAKPDEWGAENYSIAKYLLQQKGIAISKTELESLNEDRMKHLAEPKSLNAWVFVIGYMFVLMNIVTLFTDHYPLVRISQWMTFMPAAFSFVIGRLISQAKTTLPNGQRVYTYNKKALKNAAIMQGMSLAIVMANIVALLIRGD